MLANHPDYIVSNYAAQMLGAIVVQVHPMYTVRELQEIVADVEMRFIVVSDSNRSSIEELGSESHFDAVFLSDDPESGRKILHYLHLFIL